MACSVGAGGALEHVSASFGSVWDTTLSLITAMTGSYDLTIFDGSRLVVLSTLVYLLYIFATFLVSKTF